jgi:glutamyl-tRNA synthetase
MRGRFAPSPTGQMHIGNARTALLAWLQVRSAGGTMLLRMEDIDTARSRPHLADQILTEMAWLGLDWDEGPDRGGPAGPYRQSERSDWYRTVISRLEEAGCLYRCYCSRSELNRLASAPHGLTGETVYPGTCRSLTPAEAALRKAAGREPALRFRVPEETIAFDDLVAGRVAFNPADAPGDFVIFRADGVFAYQLAVVADDAAMGITHVLRGDDLLDSTPRQILLYRALGWTPPVWAHVPLLVGPDGRRFAKREGALSLAWLRGRGVRPEALVGFLAFLSGLLPSPEPVRPTDLIAAFDVGKLPRAAARVEPALLEALAG